MLQVRAQILSLWDLFLSVPTIHRTHEFLKHPSNSITLFIQGDINMYRHYIIHKNIYEKSFYCQFTKIKSLYLVYNTCTTIQKFPTCALIHISWNNTWYTINQVLFLCKNFCGVCESLLLAYISEMSSRMSLISYFYKDNLNLDHEN